MELLDGDLVEGRADHQAPEVDGSTLIEGVPANVKVGDLIAARVRTTDGVDLVAVPLPGVSG